MKIFVLISTIDNGIERIPAMLYAQNEHVHYCVVWQQTQDFKLQEQREHTHLEILRQLIRKDVSLKEMDGTGLARSRNMCMKLAESIAQEGICIFADDDEIFQEDAFPNILKYYDQHPSTDVALMRLVNNEGQSVKTYPEQECDLAACSSSYYPSSLEISFRTKLINEGLFMDDRFGLGSAWLAAGEEDVWLYEAAQHGKQIRVVPITIAATDENTTGKNLLNIKVLRSKGAVYGYTLSPFKAWLRTLREAYALHRKTQAPFFHLYRNIWSGVKYIRQ